MDMQAVKSATQKAKSAASGDMTEKHVFALLAFEDKPGTTGVLVLHHVVPLLSIPVLASGVAA